LGVCRNSTGTLPTDKLFTGQRLDSTGLYYYGARYYDPQIGRFISPDTIVPDPANPQSLNRYSYCLNNPLKYTDPTGHWPSWSDVGSFFKAAGETIVSTIESACPAYTFVTQVCEPIYQIATGQNSYQDFQTTPAQTIENIKNYYDVTTPEGAGRFTATVLIAAGTVWAGFSGAVGSTEAAAASTARSTSTALVPFDPPPGGALGIPKNAILPVGKLLDRYGGERGYYLSDIGTPIENRALSPLKADMSYNSYRVIKPLEVQQSLVMPWYGKTGLAPQYMTLQPIYKLIGKYLERLP
jgi:RHS repeat-associated protein